jgi:transketolase
MNANIRPADPSQQDFANAIRFLTADAVQAANSGHLGAPMGMAERDVVVAKCGEMS